MKYVTMIARYLLGLIFLVFGSNKFLNFIPIGADADRAAGHSRPPCLPRTTFTWCGAIMAVSGMLLLVNRYVPLALDAAGAR